MCSVRSLSSFSQIVNYRLLLLEDEELALCGINASLSPGTRKRIGKIPGTVIGMIPPKARPFRTSLYRSLHEIWVATGSAALVLRVLSSALSGECID